MIEGTQAAIGISSAGIHKQMIDLCIYPPVASTTAETVERRLCLGKKHMGQPILFTQAQCPENSYFWASSTGVPLAQISAFVNLPSVSLKGDQIHRAFSERWVCSHHLQDQVQPWYSPDALAEASIRFLRRLSAMAPPKTAGSAITLPKKKRVH